MGARRALSLTLVLALAALALGQAVELGALPRGARLEIARAKPTRLLDATRERLQALDGELTLTYFASSPEQAPAAYRRLRAEVADLLGEMERAAGGRLRYELADPEASAELAAYAARSRARPLRVRTVLRDSWSERSVWSALSIAYGARPRTSIAAIAPESLDVLQSWIVAALDELERPARPVIALAAPRQRFERLAEVLARSADVLRVEPGGLAGLDPRADALFWIDPREPAPGDARALLEIAESGRSAVVAASGWRVAQDAADGAPRFEPTGLAGGEFLALLGVDAPAGMVLDELCETDTGAARTPLPWRLRCIAPNQDFRALEGQPNGTLRFVAPSALVPAPARLDQLGRDFSALATAGPQAWLQVPTRGPVEPALLAPEHGASAPKAALAALLSPRDPRRGTLILIGSAGALADEELEREDAANRALVEVLAAHVTAPQRLVAARMRAPRMPALPELSTGERRLWRVACGAMPAALLALAFAWTRRGRASSARRGLAGPARTAAAAALALSLLGGSLALSRVVAHGRMDLTRAGLHTLSDETRAIAGRLGGRLEAELVFSRDLPPQIGEVERRLEDLLRSVAGALPSGLSLRRTHPEDLPPAQLAELARRGAGPLLFTERAADETSAREARATLLLSSLGREQALAFPDAASAEPLEFRLALALGRLAGDPAARGRIVVASDAPRLSPAEAHLEYQTRGLFAPTGADVYALARRGLERAGFEVVTRAPASTEALGEADLLVWLQPRRDIGPMLAALATQLSRGGRALVAAQHFVIRSRQPAAQGFRTVHWPEPQFPDLDTRYLPELGIELVREVLCDSSVATLELPTEVERPGAGWDLVLQQASQPFQIRALASHFAPAEPAVRGLSDQLFLCGNRIALDRQRLAQRGLSARVLIETTPQAWSIDWKGGFLDPRALDPGPQSRLGPQPLAVLVEGSFPPLTSQGALAAPSESQDALEGAAEGQLLFIGCSELFKNAHLARAGFRGDQLLLDAAASLALGPEYGRIAARRAVDPGFEPPPPAQRLRLRAWSVGAAPALLALATLAWRAIRRRGLPRRPTEGP